MTQDAVALTQPILLQIRHDEQNTLFTETVQDMPSFISDTITNKRKYLQEFVLLTPSMWGILAMQLAPYLHEARTRTNSNFTVTFLWFPGKAPFQLFNKS